MKDFQFQVTDAEENKRIDKCVTELIGEDYSRTFVKSMVDSGQVLVNGNIVKPSYIISSGENVQVHIPVKPCAVHLEPERMDLDIVHEDETIIIVNNI